MSTSSQFYHRLALFPPGSQIIEKDGVCRLTVGFCDLEELAGTYGTPLYLFDADALDAAVDHYQAALSATYEGPSEITYAGKAGLTLALARWADKRGLWVDCTGLGEMHVAATAEVDRARILVHGVNKSDADIDLALRVAGTIVVDNLAELGRILSMVDNRTSSTDGSPDLWLRVRPGTAVDTHAYRQTGQDTSKFGMSADEAIVAVRRCLAAQIPLNGIHFHQGSHFRDPTPIGPGLDAVLAMVRSVYQETGWRPQALSPGGGWGIAYHDEDLPQPDIKTYVAYIADAVQRGFKAAGLPLPTLHLEPGRSLVGRAGVALYRVGSVKQTGDRRWLLIDGGMADNIRPALYGARYSALPVREPHRPSIGQCWIGGPYCESGDVLISALEMPDVQIGEVLAIPASGAYHISMSSNYNGACKPAVLWLRNGTPSVMRRREEPDDLLLLERTVDEQLI